MNQEKSMTANLFGIFKKEFRLATILISAIVLLLSTIGCGANRLNTEELSAEVSRIMKEKITEDIKQAGGKTVSVNIKSLGLFHDGGNKYHGLVEMDIECDGEKESWTKSVDVTYDGEKVMYEIKME